jgi:hypothetical protein
LAKLKYDKRAPGYNLQCLVAIARALPLDDIYRVELDKMIKDGEAPHIEVFTIDPEIPVMCVRAQHEVTHPIVRLDELIAKGEESRLLHLYRETQMKYNDSKPLAMFVRLSQPHKLNVVMHTLQAARTSWDPAVIYSERFKDQRVFVERRTTFCRLLASIGWWSMGRAGRIVPIAWDDSVDLRTIEPRMLYVRAKELVAMWRLKRSTSSMFRDLTDEQFTHKVMEMQMERRIERGDWS